MPRMRGYKVSRDAAAELLALMPDITQASVRSADRVVVQVGTGLADRDGCVIVSLDVPTHDALVAASSTLHGNIYLSSNGVVTADPYVAPIVPPPDPQIAIDKAIVVAFMGAADGTATAAQRDSVIKAIVRYLRRRGDDA
jgi:hypothetical protein